MAAREMKDAHRLFLQSFMSKGIIEAKQVRDLYKLACKRFQEDGSDLVEFVNTINDNIKPVHLEIKKAVSEESGKQSYCLVNTTDTDFSKLAAADYTASQLDIFKRLVEKIVEADNGTVSSIEAINLPDLEPAIKMSKRDTEALYDKLQGQQWIGKNPDGHYFLTARALLELEQYIRDQYPNLVIMCNMCNKLVLQGQTCVNCDVKLHIGCATKYFERSSENQVPKCPSQQCRAPWTHPIKRKDATGTPSQPPVVVTSQRETRKRKSRS